jgi:hypothetical protein
MKNMGRYSVNIHKQGGAATLITALILLVAMTIITIFAARSAVMEQKIYANEFRAKQAFEAAEAGLEYGISYLLTTGGADKDDDGIIDDVDVDADSNVPNRTLSNNSEYHVDLVDNSGGAFNNITVISTGLSDDDSARAVVAQVVAIVPAFPNVPGNPLISKGAVSINGAAEIINPEGNATIWTGDPNVTFSGASGKTQIPDPSNPSQLIDSSDINGLGPDVIAADSTLSSMTDDQFFEAFMGTDKTSYENAGSVREVPAGDASNAYNAPSPGLDLAREEILWVDGSPSLNGNVTVGCTITVTGGNVCPSANTKPVVLVIDGNLLGNGTVKVYGLVYITGDFAGSGNLEVTGAVIMEGDVTGTGDLNVTYDSSVLQGAGNIPLSAGSLAGSWHDFNL